MKIWGFQYTFLNVAEGETIAMCTQATLYGLNHLLLNPEELEVPILENMVESCDIFIL